MSAQLIKAFSAFDKLITKKQLLMNTKVQKILVQMSKCALYYIVFQLSFYTLAISHDIEAQNKSLRKIEIFLEAENATLNEVFQQIEELTDFTFAYLDDELPDGRITLPAKKQTAEKLLRQIAHQGGVAFRRVGLTIHVKPKSSLHKYAVREENIDPEREMIQLTVSGKVTDENGSPLPGATVLEKGTINGAVTDADGRYSLTVSDENAILSFSFVGYKREEIPLQGRTQVDVSMLPDLTSLQEIVVVGYGTQERKDLTGAIAIVREEDFTPGVNSDATELLKGTAPGVVVTQTSSDPGAGGLKIRIRGANSINGGNGVLFVVDGLPGVNPADLSPGDIESIQILKDASAAAIYGTRAANGVVLIETKKGMRGKTELRYGAYYGTQEVPELIDVLGASDYMRMVNQRRVFRDEAVVYTDEEIAAAGEGTNFQEEIFQSAPVQNHQLSLSGGGDNSRFYVGLNYFDQEGVVRTSGTRKYNLRTNVESTAFDRFKIGLNLNYTHQTTNSVFSQNTDGGLISSVLRVDPTVPATIDEQTGLYYDVGSSAQENPMGLLYGLERENVARRFYASLTTDYEIVDNLTATLRLGAESNSSRADNYNNSLSQSGFANGGVASISAGESTHWLVETLLRYGNTFNEIHNFSILGGATWERFDSRGLGANSRGFISDVLGTNLLGSGDGDEGDNVSSNRFANQLNGFIGRLTYAFDDRYLLTGTFRLDGTSNFADGNKYAFFGAASVGWRIDREAFMSEADWVSQLKLRAGYGELGNQALGGGSSRFVTQQTLVANNGAVYVFNGAEQQGVVAARLPNPDLTWETTAETNIGLDYGFFNDRISGSIDYFTRKTKDQLFLKPLPSVVGFTSVWTNIGEVVNRGVDLSLNTVNLEGKFEWNTSIVVSYLENEVTSLPDFTQQIIGGNAGNFVTGFWIVEEGAPLRSYYGYEIAGIFQDGDDIENAPTPAPGFQPGMPRFVDQDNDGDIDADDRVVLGDAFPDFSYGIRNTFNYAGFTLDVFINGVQGAETYDNNVAESLYPINTFTNSLSTYYFNRYTPENPSTTLPSGEDYSLHAAQAVNSLTIVDASYIRLKTVTIAYNVPVKNTFISNLSVYAAADNLLTITDFEGYDPEASVTNSLEARTYNSYPLARTFRVGFDVKF